MTEKQKLDLQIGQNIKKAREAAGYTQERFAEKIGMGAKNISAIERGVNGVSPSAIRRICATLSISSDALLMDNPSPADSDRVDFLVMRLKQLSPWQLDWVIDVNNKLLEVLAPQEDEE